MLNDNEKITLTITIEKEVDLAYEDGYCIWLENECIGKSFFKDQPLNEVIDALLLMKKVVGL